MTLQDLKTRLLRGDSADINMAPADYATGIDYFRRMGGYHDKRILVLGTAFQKAHKDFKGKESICYVYPVNAPDNNIGWMTMASNEVLTELDYVLVVSTK